MRIVMGSDHGGVQLKAELVKYLVSLGHEPIDIGTHGSEAVDYPDFAFMVAGAVATGEFSRGIMIDGAGIGSSMVANKLPGVRAALANDLYAARNSREHNDANLLTLGARVIGVGLAQEIVRVWLNTDFDPRHQKRIDKILHIEAQLFHRR
ncbi:MAG TPA: ribose 5-phosphate isomerase B [Chroococcales cyanobacterium]